MKNSASGGSLSRAVALSLIATSLLADCTLGQVSRNWVGPAGGGWFTAANWNPAGAPLSSDFLSLSSGDEPDSGGATVQIAFGGFLDISNTANATTGAIMVGSNGLGTLAMSGTSTMTSNTATIGNADNAVGLANIAGTGTTWNVGSSLTVGNLGQGTLNIIGGADVISTGFGTLGTNSSGTGVINVTGAGSLLDFASGLTIGSNGSGTLNIANNAVVENTSSTIGSSSISMGRVSVDSRGVWTNSSSTTVGSSGLGMLEIQGGGLVFSTSITVGNSINGVGRMIVDEPDSLLDAVGSLTVGDEGYGELEVANGARVENLGGFIGSGLTGTGEIVVRHGGTWTNIGGLNVGMSGSGNVTVEQGGTLESAAGTIGTNGNGEGTVTIDGLNSTWTNTGMLQVGLNGAGTLNIINRGVVSNDFAEVGALAGSQGIVNIIGAGSEWNNGDDLTIGRSGSGEMNILNGGTVTSIGGLIANGPSMGIANIRGIGSRWSVTSDLNVGSNISSNGELTITDGGAASAHNVVIGNSGAATGTVVVSGLGSELNVRNVLTVGAGLSIAAMTIEDQANVVVTMATNVGANGSLTVDNATLTTAGLNASSGQLDFTGGVITINGGTFNPPAAAFTLDSATLATMNLAGTIDNSDTLVIADTGMAVMNYSSGATHTNGSGTRVGQQAGSSGTLNVTGAGTQFRPSDYLYVGESGSGSFNLSDGAIADSDLIVIASNAGSEGVVNASGSSTLLGSATYDIIVGNGGHGELYISDGASARFNNMTLGTGFPGQGQVVVADGGSELDVEGTFTTGFASELIVDGGTVRLHDQATLSGGSTIELDGGQLFVNELTISTTNDKLVFLSGRLSVDTLLTLADGLVVPAGGNLRLGGTIDGEVVSLPGSLIEVINVNTSMGSLNSFNAVNLQGELSVAGNTLTLNSAFSPARLGELTSISGGQIIAPAGVALGDGDTIVGSTSLNSTINGKVSAGAGSVILGQFTMGDAARVDGFVSDGTLHTFNATVTLLDANEAVLGSLTQLGHELIPGQAGTLIAANGAVLDFGRNVVGYGTVDTPDDPLKPFINNGHIAGNSMAEPITLEGYVKGVGTMDNVVITGTSAPGFSPATVNYGSVEYAGTLEIELAGLLTGSFDKIVHSGTAELGGVLDVSLINGFMPSAGNTFEIITAASGVNGTFSTEILPSLGGGLDWDVSYGTNNVVLSVVTAGLPGDFDFDGDVDGRDFLVWQRNPAVGNLADWQGNYGTQSLASSQAVPEPGGILWLVGAAVGFIRRPRNDQRYFYYGR